MRINLIFARGRYSRWIQDPLRKVLVLRAYLWQIESSMVQLKFSSPCLERSKASACITSNSQFSPCSWLIVVSPPRLAVASAKDAESPLQKFSGLREPQQLLHHDRIQTRSRPLVRPGMSIVKHREIRDGSFQSTSP